ncbi:hypothetical protein ON010_g15807 [Phytophthora cinnamomi]|nr:hypothetical protein ON010_g15807 [Phytophthora cinnamomi]
MSMGLLRSEIPVQQTNPSLDDYGVAYDRRDSIGSEYHGTQKAVQMMFKAFAQAASFQLRVESFSSKYDGVGNTNTLELTRLVESKMLPLYECKTDKMAGSAISDFFVSKEFKVSLSAISRMKRIVAEANSVERRIM